MWPCETKEIWVSEWKACLTGCLEIIQELSSADGCGQAAGNALHIIVGGARLCANEDLCLRALCALANESAEQVQLSNHTAGLESNQRPGLIIQNPVMPVADDHHQM